jgi:hypothetical protein
MYVLRMEAVEDTAYLHMDYKKPVFSKSSYEILLNEWVEILENVKLMGFTFVGSIIPKSDKKIHKFQSLFGLEIEGETEEAYIYRMVL